MTPDMDVVERLQNYLDEGERVLWQGRPLPGTRNLRFRAFRTLLGLGLLAWGVTVLGETVHHFMRKGWFLNAPIFLFFGMALIGVGVQYGFLQWRVAARAHLTTRYALTNRCAYVMVGTGFGSMNSYRILPDTAIELDRRDGYSDLWFHVRYKHAAEATETTARVGFEGIADGGMALMHLRSIQTGKP